MHKKTPQWLIDRAFNMDFTNEKKVIGTLQILNKIRKNQLDYETAINIIVQKGYCPSKERYERSTQTLYKSYGLITDKKNISDVGIELAENRITFKEMLLMQLFKKQYNNEAEPMVRPLVVTLKVLLKLLDMGIEYAWLDSYDYMQYLTEVKSYDEVEHICENIVKAKQNKEINRKVDDIKDSDIWAHAFIASGLFEQYSDKYENSFKLNIEEIELIKYIVENHNKSELISDNWVLNFTNPYKGLPEILPDLVYKKDDTFKIRGFSLETIKKVINNKLIYGMTQRENDENTFFDKGIYEESNRGFISQAILKSAGLSSKDTEAKIFAFLKNYPNILNYYKVNLYENANLEIFDKDRNYWICPANHKIYDHDKAFKEKGVIDWKQESISNKAVEGDIVFIYSTSPEKRIKYRCIVEKTNISKSDKINDIKFWVNLEDDNNFDGPYIRVRCLSSKIDDRLELENLKLIGLSAAPQRGYSLDYELARKIEKIFLEENMEDIIKCTFESNFEILGNGKNVIVFGTPGCGKSYYINNTMLNDKDYPKASDGTRQRVFRTTFYQDYSYTDFVGQILPYIEYNEKKEEKVTYKFTPGPFALALREAVLNRDKEVALVIEELNRGNAPAIFGDIFQLLDRNQDGISEYAITNIHLRDWLNNEIEGASFDKIKIPGNLNIFATMNTSDQNVFTLDTAFKRRWEFKKLKNEFKDHPYEGYFVPGLEGTTWKTFVKVINKAIVGELGERNSTINVSDKQIGVYFIDKDGLYEEQIDASDLTKDEKIDKFAYKIFSYLWDDVAKFDKDQLFKKGIITLDQLIENYIKHEVVFSDSINDSLKKKDSDSSEN